MDKSFGRLLRHSRLAAFDRTLPRVYTTPPQRKKVGDWGLKRNLPAVIRTAKLTVPHLDTSEHQTPWVSGQSPALFVKRWKENFPNSSRPVPRPDTQQHSVAIMSHAEFKRFLVHAKQRAPGFKAALANKTLVPEQIFDYLNVTFSSTAVPPVGPTYSDHTVDWNYPVEGRILNKVPGGYAVGISGVVAFLSHSEAARAHVTRVTSDRRRRTFYVQKAGFDEEGRPRIELSLVRKDGSSTEPLFDAVNHDGLFQPLFANLDTQDWIAVRPDPPPSPLPPNHELLMNRISGLLKPDDNDDNDDSKRDS